MRLVTFDGGVGELVDGAVRVLRAGSMIEWLSGSGREPTGVERDIAELTLRAPVPEPPSYRDFLTHQGHYERAMRNLSGDATAEPPAHWFEAPAFYFGNHHAILGPGQPVHRPRDCVRLDFELELVAGSGSTATSPPSRCSTTGAPGTSRRWRARSGSARTRRRTSGRASGRGSSPRTSSTTRTGACGWPRRS